VNLIEFHPFSISSAPEEEKMTLHIRELGDWTGKLGALVRNSAPATDAAIQQEESQLKTVASVPIEIQIEGPYGNMEIDVDSKNYTVWLMHVYVYQCVCMFQPLRLTAEVQRCIYK
jgi:predicted ferric reductase